MRRRLIALTVVPLMLFGIAACGNDSGSDSTKDDGDTIAGVKVSGEFGAEPTVEIDEPLDVKKTESQVITVGEGDKVEDGKQALLHLYLANGTTGEKAAATYDQGPPVSMTMADGQLFPALLDSVVGQPVGSRVLVAAIPKDAYGEAGSKELKLGPKDNVVFVVDVMSVEPADVLEGPEGEKPADVPTDIPTIEEKDGNVTNLTFENAPAKPSDELQVITLIEGEGEPARAASLVTFDYFGQIYGSEKIFDQSFDKKPVTFPLGTGGLIKGWDEGLVGVKQGSRVLVIAPPAFGYGPQGNPQAGIKGTDSLAFVVDILGVS